MLELKNISFSASGEQGPVEILNDVTLSVPDGKLVVITGPNGGGKSTLARVIMGIEKPTAGTITFDGTRVEDLSVTQRARLGISYGFQQPPRFKGMKVSDLLECAAGKNLTLEESCHYLAQVGLCSQEYIHRDVDGSLSGGELKRIEIATILARNAKLMIFDEPEAGIDLWSFGRLTDTFREIHRRETAAMVIISHQERIIRLADEVVLVAGGRITARGSAEEMLQDILADTVSSCSRL